MDNRELALGDFLALQKKESIEDTCMFFQVDYKTNWSKKKIAEALAENIRKDAIKMFFILPEEGLRFLSSLFRRKCSMEIDPLNRSYKPVNGEDFLDTIDTLTRFGLIQISEVYGEGNRLQIIAPYELKKIMAPFLKKEMRLLSGSLDLMADVVKGLLYYYGVLEIDRLFGMMLAQVPASSEELCQIVVHLRAPLGGHIQFRRIDGREYVLKARYLEMEFEGEREFEQSLVRMIEERSDLDYKAFSTEELIEASQEEYLENWEEYELLLEELWDYFILDGSSMDEDGDDLTFLDDDLPDEDDFQDFMYSVMEEVRRTGDVSLALQILEANMDFPTKKAKDVAFDHFRAYTNTISRYAFKGHTPLEMEGLRYGGKGKVIPFRKEKKVGRNDPCPCGSGKKYKNCHGRGQDPMN